MNPYKNIPGYCDYVDYLNNVAARLCSGMQPNTQTMIDTAEMGCLFGASACALYDALNKSLEGLPQVAFEIRTVDRFTLSEEIRGGSNPEVSDVIAKFGSHMGAASSYITAHQMVNPKSHGIIIPRDMDTLTYLRGQCDLAIKYDFIFLDSDHTYEHVKEEIRLARQCLKSTGILAGHDYNPGTWDGVVQAVNESFRNSATGGINIHLFGSVWEAVL